MRRAKLYVPLISALLLGVVSAGCPHEAIGPGPRRAPEDRRAATKGDGSGDAAATKRALETLCDRMEDCAVERNVALARAYGGTQADLEAARLQARIALHTGYVRRWCLMRLSRLKPPQLMRIHKCLARTACDPFYRCAEQVQPPSASAKARLPK